MKHIICFHLLNDFSGSPMVLKRVLEGILKRGYKVDLISSQGGVLEDISSYPNMKIHHYNYHFSQNKLLTGLRYVAVQIYTFFFAFRYIFTKNTFYVNTLLPIGPALAGRLMGKKVVYHYHENAFVKSTAYRMLARAMKMLASKIICVSEYQRTMLKKEKNVLVIPNALDERFLQGVHPDADRTYGYKTILMLATLKLYKGIREFITLAERLPEYRFRLVLNNSENEINQFINHEKLKITDNMTLMARVEDVAPLYNEASIVLNLTNKNYVIETFGLTVVEAMSAGLPVIVPTVGGIAEMVEDGWNGYKIDVQNLHKIAEHIDLVLNDRKLYKRLSGNALEFSKRFNEKTMVETVIKLL